MERLQVQYRIIELMSRWVVSVKGATQMNLTDLNKVSETLLVPLLSEVYELPDLRNLNTESKNFPGIDLVDDNKRVAIQVTATATSDKIKHSLAEFVENGLYKQYERLIIYILVEKQKTYSGTGFDDIIKDHIQFDKKKDIQDYRDLLEVINGFQIDQAKRILDILEANFPGGIERKESKDIAGSEFNTERQRELIQNLSNYANEYANVGILFANIMHKPLAETLISVFDLAGWRTDLTNIPLESWRHDYIEGIQILGYNKHLVEGITELLRNAGLKDVRMEVRSHKIKPDNPKYQTSQYKLEITIGHHE